ncbi:hypothetical protein GWI33_013641 [Rhynchophorus ferrugineus]|uniref:Uncharacterized protein n=1 Tax=Rhynchophorus ferrugineus TaxID=354439 RepID=A0A834MD23_RHYFE|nr:hypothetical protein GWI33_013641 [Rhynchophorus ferrugineus]
MAIYGLAFICSEVPGGGGREGGRGADGGGGGAGGGFGVLRNELFNPSRPFRDRRVLVSALLTKFQGLNVSDFVVFVEMLRVHQL